MRPYVPVLPSKRPPLPRDRWFESGSLQRGVCKLSVPRLAAKVAIGVSGGPGADKDEARTNAGIAEVADKMK
jgi:hypothetical protein